MSSGNGETRGKLKIKLPPMGSPRSQEGDTTSNQSSTPRGSLLSRSMPLKGLENFCDRMGVGLRSGLDILRLLESLKKIGPASNRLAMEDVMLRIRNGETLAESMRAQGGYFPHILVQMVDAGESGGSLERVFNHMAEYYRDLRESRTDFLRRISMPTIQLVAAIGIISLVILIQGMLHGEPAPGELQYDASGIGLRGVKGVFTFLGMVFLLFSSVALVAFGIWKNWLGCHRKLMPLIRNVPVIGAVFTNLALSRLSMVLALLLNAGVDARKCIRECFKGTGNFYYMSGMKRAEDAIEVGSSFGDAFHQSGVIPDEFVQAIEIGEMSGTETNSLERLASEYSQRAKRSLAALSVLFSTSIWVGIALFLIFMIIRMFMSYINLLNGAQNI